MHPTKAFGLNGLPIPFYKKKNWPMVGEIVRIIALSMLYFRKMLKKIYFTYIILVSNKKNPKMIMDYRPISLCYYVTPDTRSLQKFLQID